ncbi:[LysW]-aminoadipate kinase [Streptomyces sp. NBC_01335]|uniref:[LysW]-aminoadipate kinase n=1 Tax=Streptomyces sp. NBC_01335 TaxID=2903828 RepID=UPI002E11DB2E|nr:[LysW]-aminoadipate kinase [Streptomyces sp. NBC_01335]
MPSSASTSPPDSRSRRDFPSPGSTRPERIVVKLGGSLQERIGDAGADIARLSAAGHHVVVVHGGGAEADRLAAELGRPTRRMTAPGGRQSRYTDGPALDVLAMAMLGRVKPTLLAALSGSGLWPVGLSGLDGTLVTAQRNPPARAVVDGVECVVRDDHSGRIGEVDPALLLTLLGGGFTPVVSPPALDAAEGMVNVDADRLAARLAVAVGADWLILLSDVPGLLRDGTDATSVVERLPHDELDAHLPMASGRMRVKVRSAAEAFAGGVPHVVIGDGRLESPVTAARAGAGTTFVAGARPAPAGRKTRGRATAPSSSTGSARSSARTSARGGAAAAVPGSAR